MKVFAILALAVAVASGKVIRSGFAPSTALYGSLATEEKEYAPAAAAPTAGGRCEQVYEPVQVDKCVPYTDKVCKTTHKETCEDVEDKNCRAIVNRNEDRQCFSVTEQICRLREHVYYEVAQAVSTVQTCRQVTEKVCDVVYETSVATVKAASDGCIAVSNPVCADIQKTVNDKTCRTTVNFECPELKFKIIRGQHDFNSHYGCKRHYETRCYDTPRTVYMSECQNKQEEVCERLTEQVAQPVEKKVCHDEVKRVCQLEQRKEPKQVKKYSYTKECTPTVRQVCDNVEVQKLVENCVPATRKRCSLTPVEECEDVEKKHCRRITEHVPRQKCW